LSDVVEGDPGNPWKAKEAWTDVEEDRLPHPQRWVCGRQKDALDPGRVVDRPESNPPEWNPAEVEAIAGDFDHVSFARLGDGVIESSVGEEHKAIEYEEPYVDAADLLRDPDHRAGWVVLADFAHKVVDQHDHAEKRERCADVWYEKKQEAARNSKHGLSGEGQETRRQREAMLHDSSD